MQDALIKQQSKWENQQDSTLFRRGLNAGSASKSFHDVISGIKEASSNKEHMKLLVVGVAEGQEPLSLLVVLDSMAKDKGKSLDNYVSLNMVDVRPKPEYSEVKKRSKEYEHVIDLVFDDKSPEFQGFEQDEDDDMQCRIKQPIVDYLMNAINDASRSQWETKAQDYFKDDKKTYDCISYNNVTGYIPSAEDRNYIIKQMVLHLSKGGVLITDADYGGGYTLKELPDYLSLVEECGLKEVFPGVFKRNK